MDDVPGKMCADGAGADGKSGPQNARENEANALVDVSTLAAKDLREKLKSVLEDVPQKQRAVVERNVVSVAMSVVEEYSGDVLHPRIAQGWEDLCPGAADRLLRMTERQEEHRIWWERNALLHGAVFQYVGLFFALLVSLALVGGAIYCATINQPWVSGAFLAASAVGMVKAFLEFASFKKSGRQTPPETPPVVQQKPASGAAKRPQPKNRR